MTAVLGHFLLGAISAIAVYAAVRGNFENHGELPDLTPEYANDAAGVNLSGLRDISGKVIFPVQSSGKPSLLVAMGRCQSCAAAHYKLGSEVPNRFAKVVLLYEDSIDNIKNSKLKGARAPMYSLAADSGGKLHAKLVALHAPRFYKVSANGIIELASTAENLHEFVTK